MYIPWRATLIQTTSDPTAGSCSLTEVRWISGSLQTSACGGTSCAEWESPGRLGVLSADGVRVVADILLKNVANGGGRVFILPCGLTVGGPGHATPHTPEATVRPAVRCIRGLRRLGRDFSLDAFTLAYAEIAAMVLDLTFAALQQSICIIRETGACPKNLMIFDPTVLQSAVETLFSSPRDSPVSAVDMRHVLWMAVPTVSLKSIQWRDRSRGGWLQNYRQKLLNVTYNEC